MVLRGATLRVPICQSGVVPSERNTVRTKAVFDLMKRRFSFCRDFVLMGFRSIELGHSAQCKDLGIAINSDLSRSDHIQQITAKAHQSAEYLEMFRIRQYY